MAFFIGGGVGVYFVIVCLSLHKHTYDMIVFHFVKCSEGGLGVLPPKKFGFKWRKIVQF